jgi:GT2 family glycosyltransferase
MPNRQNAIRPIEIVTATQLDEADFWSKSALGTSLRRLGFDDRISSNITIENKRGLPVIYNARINSTNAPDILVFMHDDVWIDDYFFADRIIDGLNTYDVLGVAGNRRCSPQQPGWAFVDVDPETKFKWDKKENLSGSIAHGKTPFGPVSLFGPAPADCELLDGAFLAVRKSRLNQLGVLFDARFDFHFYDMDFCRSARSKGLRLTTWPICLTHQSIGGYGTPNWIKSYDIYLNKWAVASDQPLA